MLGTAVVALVTFLRNPKRIVGAIMVVLVFLTFLYILPEANKARMQSALHPEQDKTAEKRLNLWQAGLNMFGEHPIFGVGPANFPLEYLSEHPSSDPDPGAWAPHSIYIQGLAELGVAGALPLLAAWLLLFRLNARTRKTLRALGPDGLRRFEYRLSLGLDLAFIGYLVSGAFLTVLYYPHLWVLLGLSAGLCSSCLRESSEKQLSEPELITNNYALAAV
jgi:O-antigen ligase